MEWWKRVRQLDDRVNRRIGLAGTDTERAANSERWWWVGLASAVLLVLGLILILILSDWGPAVLLIPAVVLTGYVLFQSGFMYNERLRSLGEQSRWPQLRWRHHSSGTPLEPMENSSERL